MILATKQTELICSGCLKQAAEVLRFRLGKNPQVTEVILCPACLSQLNEAAKRHVELVEEKSLNN